MSKNERKEKEQGKDSYRRKWKDHDEIAVGVSGWERQQREWYTRCAGSRRVHEQQSNRG